MKNYESWRHLFFKGFALFATGLVFIFKAAPQEKDSRLTMLLKGYLENDLELQKYTLTASAKALELNKSQIENGINLQLSTGNISVTSDLSGKSRITFNPSVEAGFPAVSQGSLKFSLPSTLEDGETSVSNGSFSVTAGIVSGASKQRKITLLESERALTVARRNVIDRALSAEKEFYQSVKKLYSYAVSIHSSKNDLYDDSLNLRVLETQGYSKTSARYRQAFLKVASDRRTVQEQQRIFERETAVFAMKCGLEFSRSTDAHDGKIEKGQRDENYDPIKAGEAAYEAAIAFLPQSIPAVKPERIFDYSQEQYSKVESAAWQKYIGSLKREADYDVTLSATGEYKFNSSQSGYDDAGGKLSFEWEGLTASAGAYVPSGKNLFTSTDSKKNDNPYFQLSLSVNPGKFRTERIEKQKKQIDEQLENIAVQSAIDDYESDVLAKVSTLHDIRWAKNSYAQEYDMYTKLASDMENWLSQGIVTENDWLDALNNREKARFNIMMNAIDMLIFNNEVKLLFIRDQE